MARDIGEMNPHVYNPSQLFAQSMIYEPLVSYEDEGELKPHLVGSWVISDDGKEYVFNTDNFIIYTEFVFFCLKIQMLKKFIFDCQSYYWYNSPPSHKIKFNPLTIIHQFSLSNLF
ncbi:hypothetical protein [Salipaludibacillus agaradhaerens]|uniref:hypothetical protein n=1 Tax=Salipaludibacillus agaradhaerens TaxID=76935 RepID=UPI0035616185